MTRAAPEQDAWLAGAVAAQGYGSADPLVVAFRRLGGPTSSSVRGATATGEPVRLQTVVYTASLSKQITAACAALLVRSGRLDPHAPIAAWWPDLPAWARTVTVSHLLHHTSGLPDVPAFEDLQRAGRDRTTEAVMSALTGTTDLVSRPGSVHRYCNAGYVCLAGVLERAADQRLPDLAAERVFAPLGMPSTRYWTGPGPHPPQAAPTTPGLPAALSVGDGGVWSNAVDLLRWNDALESDELGVTATTHAPGHLDDGTALDYAWGVGVRTRSGLLVHRHGGSWAGLSAQLVRVPGRGGAIAVALDDDGDRLAALSTALVDRLTS